MGASNEVGSDDFAGNSEAFRRAARRLSVLTLRRQAGKTIAVKGSKDRPSLLLRFTKDAPHQLRETEFRLTGESEPIKKNTVGNKSDKADFPWGKSAMSLFHCLVRYAANPPEKNQPYAHPADEADVFDTLCETLNKPHKLNAVFGEIEDSGTGDKREKVLTAKIFDAPNPTKNKQVRIRAGFLTHENIEVWFCENLKVGRKEDWRDHAQVTTKLALDELAADIVAQFKACHTKGSHKKNDAFLPAPQMPTTPGPVEPIGDAPAANQSPMPHPTIDEELLSDHLTGVVFAQWLDESEDKWINSILKGKEWLKAHPEDFYCRGMLLWSILNKGNPSEMIEVLKETVQWLVSARPVLPNPDAQFGLQEWRRKFDDKIHQLSSETVQHPMFVRWHLEDTLARAALLRYLRFQRTGSQLEKEFVNLGRDLEKQIVMKWLFDSTKLQRGDAWVAVALKHINEWAGRELESGLARLCLLWFTGRQRQRSDMLLAIEQSCSWLDKNPNHSFVRWATLWLAGLLLPPSRSEEPVVCDLIEKSAEWLETPFAKDDRLVRMGFLWLVGAYGNPAQVQRAIDQTAKWFKTHLEDDFIRVAYLLFLIRRKGAAEQRTKAIAETRRWLRDHPDVYQLTDLALCLFESAPN